MWSFAILLCMLKELRKDTGHVGFCLLSKVASLKAGNLLYFFVTPSFNACGKH